MKKEHQQQNMNLNLIEAGGAQARLEPPLSGRENRPEDFLPH
jgi:hypothetical protein